MIKIKDKADCCGCTACASVCAHEAITMQTDAMGFLYPVVDETKCVDCGLCDKVCAFNDHYDTSQNLLTPDTYAVRHKNMDEVATSRSGAAFIAISDWVLQHGGVVYGVGYTDHFRVVHKRATTKEERDEFKGSKYVQSDLRGVFRQVKQDLKSGLIVQFSGTPCQTSGLNSYIGKRLRENLYLVDIVCHGVPGPYIWRDFIAYLEKKHGSEICWVNFRDKQEFGWKAHQETFKFVNGGGKMKYTYLFYQHIMFRKSCGNCHFCNTRRPSDITLADFWSGKNVAPEWYNDDKGLSNVFVNTEKGRKLFEAIKNDLDIIPCKLEDCIQPNLQHPSEIHPLREQFEKDYKQKGFKFILKKYCTPSWQEKLKSLRSRISLKSRIIRIIKLIRRR